MAAALSPTTISANKDGPTTTKDFNDSIKYLQRGMKNLLKLNTLVIKSPKDSPPTDSEGNTITKKDLQQLTKSYIAQLGDLKRMFSSKKKRSPRKGKTPQPLFYVSDQFAEFYRNADLGRVDPDDDDSEDFSEELELITEHRMANSGLCTALLSHYINYNDLKSSDVKSRFKIDKNMEKSFKNSKLMFNGKDVSKRKLREGATDKDKAKIQECSTNGKKSIFDRLEDSGSNKNGVAYYTDDGYHITSNMKLNNFMRLPKGVLTDDELSELKSSDYIELAEKLAGKLRKAKAIRDEKERESKKSSD